MRKRLQTESFAEWCDKLEKALRSLPEEWEGAHDLYATMLRVPRRKRIELVTDKNEPVAVIGLVPSWEASMWQPVTTWIVPRLVCPAKPGLFWESLRATRLPLYVGWRHMGSAISLSDVRKVVSKPRYGVTFPFDYASYWKESGQANTVHQKRKKCRKFTIKVNEPGAAEWVITNWKRHWEPDSDGSELRLRLVAAKWLEEHGRHHALVMYDGEKPIAGHTLASTAKGEVYMWQVTYKDPEYDGASPGTALMAHMFEWIEKRGPSEFDLGVDQAYKLRWAPIAGEHQDVTVSPLAHHAWRRASRAALLVKNKAKSLFANRGSPS